MTPLAEGINPPDKLPETKYINVNGRKEHEDLIRNTEKCAEIGLDQYFEIMVYLKRWGGWLNETEST